MLHDKYEENLEEAKRFEDHACSKLYDAGLVVVPYRSRKWQFLYGESRAGVEIKYDRIVAKTGNLFIETKERTSAEDEWKGAGIFGKGCLLCAGDYHNLWLFGFRTLQRAYESKKFDVRETETAVGFLLPTSVADRIAEWKDPPCTD